MLLLLQENVLIIQQNVSILSIKVKIFYVALPVYLFTETKLNVQNHRKRLRVSSLPDHMLQNEKD